jgi:Flp pilus assembly protein TadD
MDQEQEPKIDAPDESNATAPVETPDASSRRPASADTEVPPTSSTLGLRPWLFAAALVVAVFLVYQPAWQGAILFDDAAHVPRPELRSWHGLYRIWFEVLATQQYYPMTFSAFWVEHKLWGDATLGYHLVNISLHAAAALLLAVILRRLAVPGAYLAAAIFALHPVCVESVAWITELKNTLSGVFYLGAMLLYLRFDSTRKVSWYLGGLALFVFALLSKTAALMLPAVLPVIFWWQRGRLHCKRDLLPLAPFFLASGLASMMTVWVERHEGAVGSGFNLGPVERCLIAARAICFYLGKLAWPADLIFIYPRWQVSQGEWWQYLFPAAALLLLAAAWRLNRRWRGPLAALLFFSASLFPVLGFFNVYFSTFSFVADHFQYLASLGIIALFSAVAASLLARAGRRRRFLGHAGCLLLLSALALLSWRQSRIYANLDTLWRTTVDRNPDCWTGHYNLGVDFAKRGQFDEAIKHLQRVVELKPDDAKAQNNLGAALAGRGRFDEAIDHCQKALELDPDDAEAYNNLADALVGCGKIDEAIGQYRHSLELRPGDAQVQLGLGVALARRGRFQEAVEHCRKALEIEPDLAAAYAKLGIVLADSGQLEEAVAAYRRALELEPGRVEAHNNLAAILVGQGQLDEAIDHYRRALEVQPDQVETRDNLGNALVKHGQLDAAIAEFRRALEIKPDLVVTHNCLAAALARHGQLDEAIAHYRRALEIKPDYIAARVNLADALARCGRRDEAMKHYRQALDLASARHDSAQAGLIRARMGAL